MSNENKSFLNSPAIPYVLPFVLYLVLTALSDYIPNGHIWAYPIKTLLVLVSIIFFYKKLEKPGRPFFVLSVITGIAVIIPWVGLEGYYPLMGEEKTYDPKSEIPENLFTYWIAVRIFGAVVVVAIFEEIFWRGFLLRWLINPEFQKVPFGTYSLQSFLITSVFFAIEHHRWLPGLICGMLLNALFYKTRSLLACIIAHAVANLTLALYVLQTGEWKFW